MTAFFYLRTNGIKKPFPVEGEAVAKANFYGAASFLWSTPHPSFISPTSA
jgi:hypothetical protein